MKFELLFERVYPHSPEKVWHALIDPAALGEWLMENDFVPEVGRSFRMWCKDGAGGTDTYRCRLLEYNPPNWMRWSWVLNGAPQQGETFVSFRVEATSDGTKVTIMHRGDSDADVVEKFKNGWPMKLEQLVSVLGDKGEDGPGKTTRDA